MRLNLQSRQFKTWNHSESLSTVKSLLALSETQLEYEPTVETRNRKRLRPNQVAEWELRIGKWRVFYDVYEKVRTVKVEGIGRKEGNRLFLHGEEYEL